MATELTAEELIRIRLALTELNGDFCYFLDHGLVDELIDLFCEDARYSHGERLSTGRDEVRRLFAGRRGATNRTSRHIQSGLRLQVIDRFRARGQSVCLTFAANARPPVSPAVPYLVADFKDEYRLCDDSRWRIAKRHIERIFVAEENTGPEGTTHR
jgi:hypothetical protein